MTIVHAGKCRSLIEIEQTLTKIDEDTAKDKNFVFSLESLKSRHGPMHDASRLQMLVTLARRRLESDFLDIHPNASEEAAIESVCGYAPGIAAVRIAKGIRLGEITINRRDTLKAAAEKMQATDAEKFEKVIRGRTLDLICVSGSKVQYLRPLFSAHGIVKEHAEMSETMHTLARIINQQSQERVPESLLSSLGLFSTELIKNTQEHAISDHTGKPYLAHVEGMIFGWTRLNEKLFFEDFSGNTKLKKYWNDESYTTESGVSSLRFFEVSYFDSGPGLVSRFTGRPIGEMSLEEERAFLMKCLKHKTTSKPQDAAGEGLPSVLRELKKVGGLIRIRSGRLSIFNAFSTENTQSELFDFEDWSSTPLAAAEGAVISILVPLRAE